MPEEKKTKIEGIPKKISKKISRSKKVSVIIINSELANYSS